MTGPLSLEWRGPTAEREIAGTVGEAFTSVGAQLMDQLVPRLPDLSNPDRVLRAIATIEGQHSAVALKVELTVRVATADDLAEMDRPATGGAA